MVGTLAEERTMTFAPCLPRRLALSIALIVASCIGPAKAEPRVAVPKVLQALQDRGVLVTRRFAAAGGLTGWVIEREGHRMVVYTTSDQQYLLVGALLNASGRDLTKAYARVHGGQPDLRALYTQLGRSVYVVDGPTHPKAVIYAFMDPNCVYCHFAWEAMRPYVRAGLQMRWIPVGILKPSSGPKAATILAATSPRQALSMNERRFDLRHESGGIVPAMSIEPRVHSALEGNLELMQRFGLDRTPAFVWKRSDGELEVKAGMPPLAALPAMTSLPVQPEPDPELQRFR